MRPLAADVGVPKSEIAKLVRMLTLPVAWQQRLNTGETARTQIRDLLP